MAILLDAGSRIIIQGFTGRVAGTMASRMIEAATPLVGGVTPGKGGQVRFGLPVFDSCHDAVAAAGADCSFNLVPAPFVLDSVFEAIDAGIRLVTVYSDSVPLGDAMRIAHHARARGVVVLGPNAAGAFSPGGANLSDFNDRYIRPGRIGVVTKSGAITHEVAEFIHGLGMGISTAVALGGDGVTATGPDDILARFEADPGTDLVVLIGEIGGRAELSGAARIAGMKTPVVAHILGRSAPPGKSMGHAGALLGAVEENAPGKSAALREAGALVAERFTEVPGLIRRALAA